MLADSSRVYWKKYGMHLVAIGAALFIAFAQPPAGLTYAAMHALGILTWAIIAWVLNLWPDYVVTIIMCTSWVAFKAVPFSTVFSTFATDSWWLMLGALGMGVAVAKSGLLQRLSMQIMRLFPFNFIGQVLAILVSGLIVSPLIPSITSKAAIVAPFSLGVSDSLGFERKSRGAAGIFAAMFTSCANTAPLFLSASYMGYVLLGVLPASEKVHFNWINWLIAALPWGILMLAGSLAAIMLLYRPESIPASRAGIDQQLQDLGPVSRKEKVTLLILITALLAWITEPWHHLSATAVALFALCILLAADIYDRNDFRQAIPWDALISIGGIISLGPVLSYLHIDRYLGHGFGLFIAPYAGNIYTFTIVLAIIIYLVRFVIVSQLVTITLFTVLLTPLAAHAGISPWILGFIIYCSSNVWNVFYQNATFQVAFYATEGEMVSHRQMISFSLFYMIISLVALLVSIPFWKLLALVS